MYLLWGKTAAFSFSEFATAAPAWHQVAGYDIANDAPIAITGQVATFTLSAAGVVASWATIAAAFDGHDPELAMVTAQDAQGRAISIDRYSLPNPESSAAATIAATERAYLQALLFTRARVAGAGGHVRMSDPSGTDVEVMDIAVLDRRVAEARARIAWFEAAAGGNAMPRAEFW